MKNTKSKLKKVAKGIYGWTGPEKLAKLKAVGAGFEYEPLKEPLKAGGGSKDRQKKAGKPVEYRESFYQFSADMAKHESLSEQLAKDLAYAQVTIGALEERIEALESQMKLQQAWIDGKCRQPWDTTTSSGVPYWVHTYVTSGGTGKP